MTKIYINGKWQAANGEVFSSQNPVTAEVIWQGGAADAQDIDQAAQAARKAFAEWGFCGLENRLKIIDKFQSIIEANKQQLAEIIAAETGKTLWDASSEVAAMLLMRLDRKNIPCISKEYFFGYSSIISITFL